MLKVEQIIYNLSFTDLLRLLKKAVDN